MNDNIWPKALAIHSIEKSLRRLISFFVHLSHLNAGRVLRTASLEEAKGTEIPR